VGASETEPGGAGSDADAERPVYAAPRDAVTGEPLSPDALYQLTIRNRAAPPPASVRQLHVNRPMPFRGRPQDHKYWHGGPEWSRALSKLIGGVTSEELLEAERRWRDWWTNDYVVNRLRVRIGTQAVAAILAWKRDGEHYVLVTRRHRKGEGWLERKLREATGIVRAEYLPGEDRPMRPVRWQDGPRAAHPAPNSVSGQSAPTEPRETPASGNHAPGGRACAPAR
jgi:hypothetical protein